MGVFLLTPTKKAYLRYYQDLEADLMGPPEGPELLEVDTESLLRMPQEPVPGVSPSAAGLQVSCGEAWGNVPAELGTWGRSVCRVVVLCRGGLSKPCGGVRAKCCRAAWGIVRSHSRPMSKQQQVVLSADAASLGKIPMQEYSAPLPQAGFQPRQLHCRAV